MTAPDLNKLCMQSSRKESLLSPEASGNIGSPIKDCMYDKRSEVECGTAVVPLQRLDKRCYEPSSIRAILSDRAKKGGRLEG